MTANSVAGFMEEVKLQQVFKRHHKNEDIRVNCWTVIGEKFGVYQNEVLKIQEQRTVVGFFFFFFEKRKLFLYSHNKKTTTFQHESAITTNMLNLKMARTRCCLIQSLSVIIGFFSEWKPLSDQSRNNRSTFCSDRSDHMETSLKRVIM